MAERNLPWLKPLVDYGPLAIFLAAYLLWGLMTATAAIIVASTLAVLVSGLVERRIPVMPLITAVAIAVFGGLTLVLQDETFYKMKPTVVQVIFAAILAGGLAFKQPLLKRLMSEAWPMDEAGWHRLTLRFALFFLAMAGLNELVWRTQSTDFWVGFKVFGITGLTIVFVMCQLPLLRRHALAEEARDQTT